MARTKGESFAGHQHADMWFLEENGDGGDGGESGEGGKKACPWTWSKVKSTGVVPNLKSGAAMAGCVGLCVCVSAPVVSRMCPMYVACVSPVFTGCAVSV